ncbi:nitrogenase cofactor biosynthesis protein NifB [Pseudaeromonas sharmana]|uniref:FeMo cofactor biosynthesis protein NifB n=1 Tax=Pseudaeromonas sharmana TaxID=328412 RepID=A0ABV8CKJ0_9GAMM
MSSSAKTNTKSCASSCHPSSGAASAGLNRATLDKVAQHPCYSPTAHHRYARMHLAVAPACNVQCHYCNRKFDCANESRPGVVSEVLSPNDAIRKAKAVAAAIPQLSVIGIAGPGDPLANPTRTFDTLEGLRSALPDVKLCVSTNGLALPASVDALVKLGVDHVTITMNAIDAHVSANIYDWFYFEGRRLQGRQGAQLLIDQQIEGLRKLVERGVLVKINSVLIPGINDAHLPEVSDAIRGMGAFLHNIMPLIARPEHGTFFGLNGQREPLPYELDQVRDLCGGSMPQMSHCQQCRADAVGMLGEDRSQEFNLEQLPPQSEPYHNTMQRRTRIQAALSTQGASEDEDACLVAVASESGEAIDQHFGHARRFHIYAVSSEGAVRVGERHVPLYCHGASECDESEQHNNLMTVLDLLSDVDAVFCARVGMAPWQQLEEAGIAPVVDHAWQPIRESLQSWWSQRATAISRSAIRRGVA